MKLYLLAPSAKLTDTNLMGRLLGQLRMAGPNLAGDPKLDIFTE